MILNNQELNDSFNQCENVKSEKFVVNEKEDDDFGVFECSEGSSFDEFEDLVYNSHNSHEMMNANLNWSSFIELWSDQGCVIGFTWCEQEKNSTEIPNNNTDNTQGQGAPIKSNNIDQGVDLNRNSWITMSDLSFLESLSSRPSS
ncbi:3741_t:CDS:2, partial [Funneliformis mosseae]